MSGLVRRWTERKRKKQKRKEEKSEKNNLRDI
jgi:hypothetical protein